MLVIREHTESKTWLFYNIETTYAGGWNVQTEVVTYWDFYQILTDVNSPSDNFDLHDRINEWHTDRNLIQAGIGMGEKQSMKSGFVVNYPHSGGYEEKVCMYLDRFYTPPYFSTLADWSSDMTLREWHCDADPFIGSTRDEGVWGRKGQVYNDLDEWEVSLPGKIEYDDTLFTLGKFYIDPYVNNPCKTDAVLKWQYNEPYEFTAE